jgi:phosphoserine phosphatase
MARRDTRIWLPTLRAEQNSGLLPVFFIRHGRTASNSGRRLVGALDVPLDALGLRQSEHMARSLKDVSFAAIYTSPLVRAQETATAIGPFVVVDGLRELGLGVLEGRSDSDFRGPLGPLLARWSADPVGTTLPGGETFSACQARALGALFAIVRRHRPVAGAHAAPIAVVSHQFVLAALLCAIAGRPLAEQRAFQVRNTAVSLASWSEERGWRLLLLDDVSHLDPEA